MPRELQKYTITATLIIRCEITTETRERAKGIMDSMLDGTMSWQAWGETFDGGDVDLNWLDGGFPIITGLL